MKKALILLLMLALSNIGKAQEIDKSEIFETLEDCIDCKESEEEVSKSGKVEKQLSNIDENILQSLLSYYDAYFYVSGILDKVNRVPTVNTNNVSWPKVPILSDDKFTPPQWEDDKSLTSDYRLEFNPTYYDFTR
jgi:hypothetical protein